MFLAGLKSHLVFSVVELTHGQRNDKNELRVDLPFLSVF